MTGPRLVTRDPGHLQHNLRALVCTCPASPSLRAWADVCAHDGIPVRASPGLTMPRSWLQLGVNI